MGGSRDMLIYLANGETREIADDSTPIEIARAVIRETPVDIPTDHLMVKQVTSVPRAVPGGERGWSTNRVKTEWKVVEKDIPDAARATKVERYLLSQRGVPLPVPVETPSAQEMRKARTAWQHQMILWAVINVEELTDLPRTDPDLEDRIESSTPDIRARSAFGVVAEALKIEKSSIKSYRGVKEACSKALKTQR